MDMNFGILRKPGHGDASQFGMAGPNADIMSRMLTAASAYKGKAGPANQPFIVDKLKEAGFTMGEITDWLPHLMFRLGVDSERDTL